MLLTGLEALLLIAYHRRTGRGLPPATLLINLLSGVSLMLALRRRRPGLLLLAPIVGYGAAWIGHFFVEGNRPASFNKPLWSFLGDQRMWWKTLRGQMSEEVEKVRRATAAT